MISVTPAYTIGYLDFERYLKGDIDYFVKELDEMRIRMKQAAHYSWDNNQQRFSNLMGTEFKFFLSQGQGRGQPVFYTFSFWALEGISLMSGEIIPDGDRQPLIKKIWEICSLWCLGSLYCCNSQCGTIIPYRENMGHRFYAGIYCPKCWDERYGHLAATEKYD